MFKHLVLVYLSVALVTAYPYLYETDYISSSQDCQRLPSSTDAENESKGGHINTAVLDT